MLEKEFERLYLKFRANYYKRMVEAIGTREGSLSATESFCVEIIYLMERPTLSAFADFLSISLPNATYKVNSLVRKGYIRKLPSLQDKRETYLEVTDKFLNYYGLKNLDIANMMKRIRQKFSEEEIEQLERFMTRLVDECMD